MILHAAVACYEALQYHNNTPEPRSSNGTKLRQVILVSNAAIYCCLSFIDHLSNLTSNSL